MARNSPHPLAGALVSARNCLVLTVNRQAEATTQCIASSQTSASSAGLLAVAHVAFHHRPVPVYNLEVHGEHVYQVTNAGILVHNAGPYGIPKVHAPTPQSIAPSRAAGYFDDLATAATRNAESTKLVLGKWSTTGQSYQNVAAHYKATYFKLEKWRELEKTLSREELWKINEAFLRQQIKQGKQIILSHDPTKAMGFFKNEVDFVSNFFRFEKDGWVWKAVPK